MTETTPEEKSRETANEKTPLYSLIFFDTKRKPRTWFVGLLSSLATLALSLIGSCVMAERQNHLQILRLAVEKMPDFHSKSEACRLKLDTQMQEVATALDKNYGSDRPPAIDAEPVRITFSECNQALLSIEALMKAAEASGADAREIRADLERFRTFLNNEIELRTRASSIDGRAVPHFIQTFAPLKKTWAELASKSLDKIK